MIGLVAFFIGILFPQHTKAADMVECSGERFMQNWKLHENSIDFFYTFSIIFPGFGGILAGSNGSGALKRPQVSIPLGTISALVSGTLVYIVTVFAMNGCHDRMKLMESWRTPIQETSIFWPLVFIAIVMTVVSKGVTGLGTGPMILRLMSNDGFTKSFVGNYSLMICTALCFSLTMWADLNTISFIRSMMFLLVFAFINFGLYEACVSHIPSFRPTWKFYNPYVSLICFFLIILSMLIIHWIVALICFGFSIFFYIYFSRKHINQNWGTLDDSVSYDKALKAALDLRRVHPHPKLYRPNIILIIDSSPAKNVAIITFLDQMLKGKGMAIVARMFPHGTKIRDIIKERSSNILKTGKEYSIFYETVIADTKSEAIQKLMLLTGLGALRANVAFIEFDETLSLEGASFISFVLDMKWSLIILRNPMRIPPFGTIDLWWLADDGGLSLLIASILSGNSRPLRAITVALTDIGQTTKKHSKKMRHLLRQFRVNASVVSVPLSESETSPSSRSNSLWAEMSEGISEAENYQATTKKYKILADLIRSYSSGSNIIIISLPVPRTDVPGEIYIRWLSLISYLNVPVLFIRGNGTHTLSWQV